MKFKVGDKVRNIINGAIGKITYVEKEEEVDKNRGYFNSCYYVDYNNNYGCYNSIAEIEKVPEILDETEKKYLSNVIKPFKDRVKFIYKRDAFTISNCEYIIIDVLIPYDIARKEKGVTTNTIILPMFKKNTMYKGMETFKKYTLKELNLE